MAGDGYTYYGVRYSTRQRLFLQILLEETEKQLGLHDIGTLLAIITGQTFIPTRSKFSGATKGTSIASVAFRRVLNYNLPFNVRTLTKASIRTLKWKVTRHLGAIVGRAVPILGYAMAAEDVTVIMYKTVATYNKIVDQSAEPDEQYGR